jgi:hypothetical protein
MEKHLSLSQVKRIKPQSQIKIFFEKGYGFELLMILWENYSQCPQLSIEKTLELLSLHQPRRETFSRFINRLESNGCIKKSIHPEKKSMRSINLSEELYNSLNQIS